MNLHKLINEFNLDIKGVIHIGAHVGGEYSIYKEVKIESMMFFEPLPHTFEKLKNNVGPEVVLYNLALGNKVGKEAMYVEYDNDSQSSSILEPHLHKEQYPSIVFTDKIEVSIDKLDNIQYDKDSYNFINIDVQGYELEVFRGALVSLKSIDYIMAEVNRGELYRGCALVDDLDDYLALSGFKRVITDWAGDTWGDALYIKK